MWEQVLMNSESREIKKYCEIYTYKTQLLYLTLIYLWGDSLLVAVMSKEKKRKKMYNNQLKLSESLKMYGHQEL